MNFINSNLFIEFLFVCFLIPVFVLIFSKTPKDKQLTKKEVWLRAIAMTLLAFVVIELCKYFQI